MTNRTISLSPVVDHVGKRVKVRTHPTHFAHRRIGKVADGPYWKVVFHNGDVFYATLDELEEAPANE